MSAVANK